MNIKIGMSMAIDAIQQNYQYGNYEFGRNNPFGQVNGIGPKVQGPPMVENQYGISIPENFALVDNEYGVGISQGLDGVGLAHYADASKHQFHAIC